MLQKFTLYSHSKKYQKISILLLILGLLFLSASLKHIKTSFHPPPTTIYAPPSLKVPQGERYITYLPHSGLSNQRIELSNALMLAYMFNRTLIVPPAFLGSVFGWMEREQLEDHLSWLTTPKNFGKICQKPTPGRLASYLQRSKCDEHRQTAVLPWTDLHDFSSLDIKLYFQSIVSTDEIKKSLNILDNDIYHYNDTQLYDWRLYEDRDVGLKLLEEQANYFDSFAGRSFYKVLLMDHFESRPEKLIYLGGTFGTTRLNIAKPEHVEMQKRINQALHYRLDGPLGDTVNSVVDYLGGRGTFLSLHFRTADRPFSRKVGYNLRNFVSNMTALADQYDLELENMNCPNEKKSSLKKDGDSSISSDVKIYIATDHKDPRGESSSLLPWFTHFPCTTTLNDLPSHLFDALDDIKDNVSPKKSLKPFLFPIIDAMIAAHGRHVLTTPRSTFSKYIEELHDFWF